jgi:calcineurin-like phosphoesterase family protein
MYDWFTSDTHFFHKKILEYNPHSRQGADAKEMTELMIQRWNAKVRPSDRVAHLGDFSFGKRKETEQVMDRLNGIIDLYKGNHDGSWLADLNFNSVHTYGAFRDKTSGKLFTLFHFPIESWDEMHHGAIHLHGHLHGDDHHTCRLMPNRMDVGVDCRPERDMAPFHYDEVMKIIEHRNAFIIDAGPMTT